jgi:hypothetical protein
VFAAQFREESSSCLLCAGEGNQFDSRLRRGTLSTPPSLPGLICYERLQCFSTHASGVDHFLARLALAQRRQFRKAGARSWWAVADDEDGALHIRERGEGA